MTVAMFAQPTHEQHGEPCVSTEQKAQKETLRPTVRFASFMGARHLQGSIFAGMVKVRVEKLQPSKP
jgi:hypothetical protein